MEKKKECVWAESERMQRADWILSKTGSSRETGVKSVGKRRKRRKEEKESRCNEELAYFINDVEPDEAIIMI